MALATSDETNNAVPALNTIASSSTVGSVAQRRGLSDTAAIISLQHSLVTPRDPLTTGSHFALLRSPRGGGGVVGDGGVGGLLQQMTVEHVAALHKLFVDEGMIPMLLSGGSGAGSSSRGGSPARIHGHLPSPTATAASGSGGGGSSSNGAGGDMSSLCIPIHRFCDEIFRILSSSGGGGSSNQGIKRGGGDGDGGGNSSTQHPAAAAFGCLDHSSSWVASKSPQALREEIYRWSLRISTAVEGVRPRPSALEIFAALPALGTQNDGGGSSKSFIKSPSKRDAASRISSPTRAAAAAGEQQPERLHAFQMFGDSSAAGGGGGKSPKLVVRWSDVTSCFIQDEETKDMAEENRADFARLTRKIVRCQVHHMHACSPSHAIVTSTGRNDTKLITGGRDGVVKIWASSTSAFESTISNSGDSWVVGLCLLNSEHYLMVATSNAQVLVCDFPKGNIVQVYLGCSNLDAAVDEVTLPSVVHTHRFGMTPGESGPRQVHFANVGELTQEAFTEKRRTARSGPQTRTVAVKPIVGYVSPTTLRYIEERGLCFFGNVHGTVGYFDLTEDLRQASLITGSSVKSIKVAFSVSVHLDAAVTAIRYVRRLSMLLTAGMDGCIYKISMEGSNWTHHALPVRHNVQDTGARPILGMEWSESAQMLVTYSSDRTVKFWSLMRSEPLHVLDGLAADVLSITLIGRDRVAVLTADKTISVFELRAFRVVQTITQSVTGENSGGQLHVCSHTIIKSHSDEGGCLLYDDARQVLTCCLRSPVQYASGAALSVLESNPQHHSSSVNDATTAASLLRDAPDKKLPSASTPAASEGDSGGISVIAAAAAAASPSLAAAAGLLTPRSAAASSGVALRAVSPVTQHQHPLVDLVVQRANMQAFSIDEQHVFSWDITSGKCLAVATVARQLQKVVMPPHARGSHFLTKCGWAGAETQLLLCGTQSGCLLTWNAGMNGIVRVDAVSAAAAGATSPRQLPPALNQRGGVAALSSGERAAAAAAPSPRSPRSQPDTSGSRVYRHVSSRGGGGTSPRGGGGGVGVATAAGAFVPPASAASVRANAATDVSCIAHLGQHALVCSSNRVTLVSYDLSVQFPDGNHRSTLRTMEVPTRTSITAARFLRDAMALIGTLDATLFLCSLEDGKTLFSTRIQDRNGEDEVCGIEEIVVLNRRKQNVALVMLEHGAMNVWHAGTRMFVHHVRFFRKYDGRINAACVSYHEEFLTVGDTYGRVFVYDVRAVSSATSDWRSAIQHLYYFQASVSPIVALGLQERVEDDEEDLFLLVGASDGSLRLAQLQRDGATHVGVFGEDDWDWSVPETFSHAQLPHHTREPRHIEGDMFLETLLREAKRRDDSPGGHHHLTQSTAAHSPPGTAATRAVGVDADSTQRGEEMEVFLQSTLTAAAASVKGVPPLQLTMNSTLGTTSSSQSLAPHRPQTQHHHVRRHANGQPQQTAVVERGASDNDKPPFDMLSTQFLVALPSLSNSTAAPSLRGTLRLDGTLNGVPLLSPWQATPPSTAPGGSRAAVPHISTAAEAMSSCLHVRKRFIQAPDIDLGNGQHLMDRLTEQSLQESQQERSTNPILPHYRRYGYHPHYPPGEAPDGTENDPTTGGNTAETGPPDSTGPPERELSLDSGPSSSAASQPLRASRLATSGEAKDSDFFITAVGSSSTTASVRGGREDDDTIGVPVIAISEAEPALDDGDPLQPQSLANTTSNMLGAVSSDRANPAHQARGVPGRHRSITASSYVATSYAHEVDDLGGSVPVRSAEEEAREHTRQLLLQMAARLDLVQPNGSPQRKFMRRVERLYESEEQKQSRRLLQQQRQKAAGATSPERGGERTMPPSREANGKVETTAALDDADDQADDIMSYIRSPQTAKNFQDLEEKLRQYKKHREGIIRQPPPAPPPASISVGGSLQSLRLGVGGGSGGAGGLSSGGGGSGGVVVQPRRPITVQDPLWLTRVSSQLYLEDVVFTLPSTVAAAMYGSSGGPQQQQHHRATLHRGLSLFGSSGNVLSPAGTKAARHGQPRTAR